MACSAVGSGEASLEHFGSGDDLTSRLWLYLGASQVVLRQCRRCNRLRFDPWVGKIPWRRKWQPPPVLLPGKFHGQRKLVATAHGVTKSRTWLSTQHIHHSFYNTSLPCLGKLHFCTSSRSLSPDLGQAAIHLINWPISKAPSVEYSGLPSFARKEMYHLQSSSVCQGHSCPCSIFHVPIRNQGRYYYFHFWVKISELFWKKLQSIEWQHNTQCLSKYSWLMKVLSESWRPLFPLPGQPNQNIWRRSPGACM